MKLIMKAEILLRLFKNFEISIIIVQSTRIHVIIKEMRDLMVIFDNRYTFNLIYLC